MLSEQVDRGNMSASVGRSVGLFVYTSTDSRSVDDDKKKLNLLAGVDYF